MRAAANVVEVEPESGAPLDHLVARVCSRVAPVWPLDRFIAVSPFWEQTDRSIQAVSEDLARLEGARLVMPRSWYREQLQSAPNWRELVERCIRMTREPLTIDDVEKALQSNVMPTTPRVCVLDVADELPQRRRDVPWRHFVVNSMSQFAAAYFDEGQSQLPRASAQGLYATWRRQCAFDRSPSLLMGAKDFVELASKLPSRADELFVVALGELGIAPEERESYLNALLADVRGWASWCAYLRWTRRLSGAPLGEELRELLAIRLAWEWLVFRIAAEDLRPKWAVAMREWSPVDGSVRHGQTVDWVLQRAVELAWQEEAIAKLLGPATPSVRMPKAQAVFCIDVRSEPMRRALEAESADVQTRGFAGFFGLPVEFQPLGSTVARPQLPGLFTPRLRIEEATERAEDASLRRAELRGTSSYVGMKSSPASAFAFVESLGLSYAANLVRDSLRWPQRESRAPRTELRLVDCESGKPLSTDARAELALGMLRAMSLVRGFARVVLLVGHGSQTRNNPHAAGLDCGACSGQSGEVNARAAASLLNDRSIRAELLSRGMTIPDETWFVAGLHDTTTDEIELFDPEQAPATHREDLASLRGQLERASRQVRRERAPKLGMPVEGDEALLEAFRRRANDWSEVRPEWGLAGNAGFVIAPRERTRGIDFGGRVFLHDYCAADDPEGKTLELLLTAPVIVAHWINSQYYASTVEPRRFGSGNKVLHNVVGGHIGVFEGNGGDLKVGLPLQSLHDGTRWVHSPLRLSVFIEAPREAIERVVQTHQKLRELVAGEWLFLYAIESEKCSVQIIEPVARRLYD